MVETLRIDIVSDVVCPWCIIGFKHLLAAMARFEGELAFELHWHPFELNPDMPAGGENLRAHLAAKYGTTLEGSIAARQRLTEMGAELGFRFDYFDEMRMFNTFKAHQLLHWAGEQGLQTELKMALFKAYFGQRQSVDEEAVLCQCAEYVGLDAHEAAAVLADGRYGEAVRLKQQFWRAQSIHAVPAFIFNQQRLMSGAQEIDTFIDVIAQLKGRPAETEKPSIPPK